MGADRAMVTIHDRTYRNQSFSPVDFLINGVHLAVRGTSHLWTYEERIKWARNVGWSLIRMIPSYRRRVDDNLRLVFPDLSDDGRAALMEECARNIGQSLMEHMHMAEFAERIGHLDMSGPGMGALDPERGAILVSGHFGQWEGVRIAWRHLTNQPCGFFFRPNNNGFYDRHWQEYLRQAGTPNIPKGGAGRAMMAEQLLARRPLLMVIDQAIANAERLEFLGHPARTATTAAELALEHDMPLIPAYAVRRANLVDYDVIFEAPVPPSDPVTMTQALNTSLASRILDNPEQYLWTHRRWR